MRIRILHKDPYPGDNNRRKLAKKCRNFQEIFNFLKNDFFSKIRVRKIIIQNDFYWLDPDQSI